MYLQRLASSLRRRDWASVVIELMLVIFGVLIALQVNNWNAARADKEGAINTLVRLRGEVVANVTSLNERMGILEESTDIRRAGMIALQTCDTSTQAKQNLSEAMARLTGDIIPSFVDNTLRELARQDRYLDLLSNEFRAALNLYSARLFDEREQLKINFELMWDQHVTTHPMVGIEVTNMDIQEAAFVFSQPMEVLCKDSVFRRRFLMTDGWHQSAVLRMQRFKESNEKFLTEIDAELKAL